MTEEEILLTNYLKKKFNEKFLEKNQGKWVIVLIDGEFYVDNSLEVLLKQYKDKKIKETFKIPSKDMVMLI
ncbi:MAG: hypothetical protein ACFFCV_11820 [Promethearchaeota archaeon]